MDSDLATEREEPKKESIAEEVKPEEKEPTEGIWGNFFKNLGKIGEAAPLAKQLRVLVHPDKYKSEKAKKRATELSGKIGQNENNYAKLKEIEKEIQIFLDEQKVAPEEIIETLQEYNCRGRLLDINCKEFMTTNNYSGGTFDKHLYTFCGISVASFA